MVHASSAHTKLDVYRQRKPQESAYYRCVEDCFETFEQVYQERFEQKYGFFRPYVRQVIYRYLDCGILKNGFARVRCEDCGHEYLLKVFYTNGVRDSKAVPGAVVAIQTFGDFPQGFHPHLHILVSDGCFHGNGMFSVSPTADTKALEQIFRHKVLKMLVAKEKITQDMIMLLDKWRHTGFNVFFANAPPIDVFPTYDEQTGGPGSDDYIRDPEYPADLSRRSSTCWVVAESEA